MNFARVNLPTISGSFKEEAIRQRIQDYGHMLGLVWLVFSGPYQHVVAVVLSRPPHSATRQQSINNFPQSLRSGPCSVRTVDSR